ncbi:MAG TPA: acyltransferase, partial [Acidimicrobiia bacterium]|nr:acyltransferase [Acidimicrobiia bacterium]
MSYGLYLWHWPVQVALSEPRTGLSGWDLGLLRLAVTFAAATLSYYLVELPIRHGALKGRLARAATPLGFAAVTAVILVSTAGATTPPEFLTANPNDVISTPSVPGADAPPTGTPAAELGTVLLVGDSIAASVG